MAYRTFSAIAFCLVILVGCGEPGPGVQPPPFGGTGGTGAVGTGSTGGIGSFGGTGGVGSTGGTGGVGSTGGTGGVGSTGGTGGTAGDPGPCNTNTLCRECPGDFLCNGDNDCSVGWECISTGCTTQGGGSIKQCMSNTGGFCMDNSQCRAGWECVNAGIEGFRCVKTYPGCVSDLDCVQGFSCEGGGCVDRRVPCELSEECPVSYSCEQITLSNRFCVRLYETCETELDCAVSGVQHCVDVDGDGSTECAPSLSLNGPACLNSGCGGATPVCEASEDIGTLASCGQYGLCQSANDCADSTFECVALWNDGRKECVKKSGSCDHITDCPVNQVCASPRTGGSPACQAGVVD